MAHECTDQSSSVAISPPTQANWWDLHHNHNHYRHANSVSSWINAHDSASTWQQHQPNPSSNNSSCDEDISMSTSFTNASNHSGLTVESSRRLVETASSSNELMVEQASDSQLWSHLLIGIGSNGDIHNSKEVGENSLDAPSTKNLSSDIFDPACDYLKKPSNSWEFTNSLPHLNNYEKHMNVFNDSLMENEKLSKLVNNWTIAPPEEMICNISLCSSLNQHYSQPNAYSDSTSCAVGSNRDPSTGLLSSCYNGHDVKVENHEHRDNIEAPGVYFRRSFNGNTIGYNLGLSNSVMGDNKYYRLRSDVPCGTRNVRDVINFNGRISKQLIDVKAPKNGLKSLNSSDGRKLTSSTTAGRGNEGKKKRLVETSDTNLKKPKHESSTASSVKAPKVKLGDRITALQQIVSPFGKTDTASVLYEAIQYIKFLQEQVQLLSNPYMKTNSHKDPWGSFDRKDKGDAKLDLRSRGLCLVPISCTPQVYHENTGTDYWTPTYRGCLYR